MSMAATNAKVSNYIPDDIVFSILSKLPIKSFKRFECVRKSWSLLFQNHHFINMFRTNLFSNTYYYDGASLLLRVYEHDQYNLFSLSGERFESKVKLECSYSFLNDKRTSIFGFGSINGTLCFYGDSYIDKIVLWNPTTHTFNLLPPSRDVELVQLSDDAMDFDSLYVDTYIYGFGYDDLTNDYKVLRCVCITGERAGYGESEYESLYPFWEIYSLRSNSWKKLDDEMPYCLDYIAGTQVYMDGVCHWFALEDIHGERCVVSFYLSNEEFLITPIPSDDDYFEFEESSWLNLVLFNRSIALISYELYTTFHISILGEFGVEESWTKLLTIGPLACVECPIGVGTKGELFFIRKDNELVWLDLSTQMMVEFGCKGMDHLSQITLYKECILPIGGISSN